MKNLIFSLILTLLSIYSTAQSLSGLYTLGHQNGQTYDFSSFQEAIDSLETYGVSGPVVIQVDSGIYNEFVHINYIAGASAVNSLTFTSLSGDSSEVIIRGTISAQNPSIFQIDSSKYIHLNKLSFIANGFGTSSTSGTNSIIEIDYNSHYISINNCVLHCTEKGANHIIGVLMNGTRAELINNKIENCASGLFNFTYGYYFPLHVSKICQNHIINFKYSGISCEGNDTLIIEDNLLETDIDSVMNRGIEIGGFDPVSIKRNTILNTNIGFYVLDGSNFQFSNNFISINRPNYRNSGIFMGYQAGGLIDFNSINIVAGDSLSSCVQHDIEIDFQNYFCLYDIKNNILKNSIGPIFDMEDSTLSYVDYNVMDCSGNVYAYLGVLNAAYATLADLQTSNKLTNSHDSSVYFTSGTDLHLSSNQFAGLGTNNYVTNPSVMYYGSQNITNDIDLETRNPYLVRPGADEYFSSGVDIYPVMILNPKDTVVSPAQDSIRVVVFNNSSLTVYPYQVKIDLSTGQSITYSINSNLLPYQKDTLILTNLSIPLSGFVISATTIYANDINPLNDSIAKNIVVKTLDIGIDSIIQPSDTLISDFNPVKIIVHNYGNTIVDTVPLVYSLGAGNIVFDTLIATLYPSDTLAFTFQDSIPIYNSGTYTLCVWNALNDINPYNDSICKIITLPTHLADANPQEIIFQILPNPNDGIFQLRFDNTIEKAEIKLSDLSGREVYREQIQNTQFKLLDLNLSKGYYTIQVKDNKGLRIHTKMLVIN